MPRAVVLLVCLFGGAIYNLILLNKFKQFNKEKISKWKNGIKKRHGNQTTTTGILDTEADFNL